MKDSQTKIKNNLQGNNTGVNLRIESMICNIRKQKTTNQNNKKKKNPKKTRIVETDSGINFRHSTLHHRGDRRSREKKKKLEICLKK